MLDFVECVPYVGPGPHVVYLNAMPASRCTHCGREVLQVPARHALDVLIAALANLRTDHAFMLAFEEGRWRLMDRVTAIDASR
jgi:hypothetical protein